MRGETGKRSWLGMALCCIGTVFVMMFGMTGVLGADIRGAAEGSPTGIAAVWEIIDGTADGTAEEMSFGMVFPETVSADGASGRTAAVSDGAIDKADANINTAIVNEVRAIIEAYYPLEIPPEVMTAVTIEDMLEELGDPYAHYLSVREFSDLMNGINMSFVGIGVVLEAHSEGVVVSQVFPGSPAAEAGLLPGDVIVGADGVDFKGIDWQESVSLLKGEEGTLVDLRYSRGTEMLTARVERRAVRLPQVTGEVIDTVGCIAVSSFGLGVDKEFQETVLALRRQGAQSWVIDLSGNGGGLVDSALQMLGFFIGGQDAVIWQTSREKSTEGAVNQSLTIDEPVIILADNMTASASEIVIGALQDYEKAVVLGGQTYGSGRFKQIYPLSNGDYFIMTITQFFTPKEKPVDFVGLAPDIKLSEEDAVTVAKLLLKGSSVETGGAVTGETATGETPTGETATGEAATDEAATDGASSAESAGMANRNETGYLKWQVGAHTFRVALDEWRKEENWHAGQELIDQCFGLLTVSVGNAQGWQLVGEEDLAERWPVYFPGYRLLGKQDMTQSGSTLIQASWPDGLQQNVDQAELIDMANGRRIEVSCRLHEQGLEITPQQSLSPDQTYWLVIADGRGQGAVAVLRTP